MSQTQTHHADNDTGMVGAAQTDGKAPEKGPGAQPMGDDASTPGEQERPMTDDEALDEALAETFPTSDPIAPSRIDGPGN